MRISLSLKSTPLYIAAFVLISIVAVIMAPRLTFAAAGSGGGGGSNGCAAYNYSTCAGAVWRYYKTGSNSYPIKNVGAGYTYVNGCASTGGFFAYVLFNKYSPNDPNLVRSWKIGPVDGLSGNRSMFFGGWTNYKVYSNPGDGLPVNPNPGDYSWYSVEKAFAQTKSLGQNSGYEWNGSSQLGWFCYRGVEFNLTPTISTNPSDAVTASGTVTATGNVYNAGPTQSSDVAWQISQFTKTAANPTTGGKTSQDPKAYYKGDTAPVASGTGTTQFPLNNRAIARAATIPDLPVGTKICFVMSVKPYNQTTSDWYHSDPVCVVIAKRPIAQILGGDLRVGAAFTGTAAASNVLTSVTIKSGKSYGSWVEYGILAKGTVTGAGSGSVYSNGLTCTAGCVTSTLSFANETAGTIGKFSPTTNIPDVAASFSSNNAPQYSSLADAALQRVETAGSNITITGGNITKGQWLVINAKDKVVTISGDINYVVDPGNKLQKIADIPQLVIIADQINIEGNVKNIDAWLIASGETGTINTCTKSGGTTITLATKLTKDLCKEQLVINGPVMAKKLYLRRTAGADNAAQIGIPAEVINLRPDAYLWGTYQASRSARLETTYSQELPPRF